MTGALPGAPAGADVRLDPVTLAAEPAGQTSTAQAQASLPRGVADWVYLPVQVPAGVARLHVRYRYDRPDVPDGDLGNACDVGLFDERGTALCGPGFRGWSGGARTEFFVAADDATPGYVPGPVNPGRWAVLLGPYHEAPAGLTVDVEVTATFGPTGAAARSPSYPPVAVAGRGAGWYRGDCHLHTVHSDGKRTPEQMAAEARSAGLDFIVSSEHNTTSAHRAWAGAAGDDLLIGLGEEVTTRNGHWLALGTEPEAWIDWRYRAIDARFDEFAALVHRHGGIVAAAHPYAPCLGCRFKFGYEQADAIEVWNGPWTLDDEVALHTWDNLLVAAAAEPDRRRWVPAMGNSDAHAFDDRVGLAQTVVQAEELSVTALQAGIVSGRSWLAESSQVSLQLRAETSGAVAEIGERLGAPADAPVLVRLEVAGVPHAVLSLWTDQGQVYTARLDAAGTGRLEWPTSSAASSYVRAEVRHPHSDDPGRTGAQPMAAMTNPIWLG